MSLYRSLLLVDDDVDDHEIFLSALEKVYPGIAVSTSESGLDALEKLEKKHVTPEIIFLDINMPLMNGLQFLDKIKQYKELQAIPVIIYSTTSAPKTIAEAKRLGAHDFISKPENFGDLETILRRTLTKVY